MIIRLLVGVLGVVVCLPVVARAQDSGRPGEPIGPFAADVRVTLPRFNENRTVAAGLGVEPGNLPTRGLGLVGGAHWYPARLGPVTIGLGGELLVSRGSRVLETAGSPTVNTTLSALSPQLSLNFGASEGWSYLSGGMGWARLASEREDQPLPDPERVRALHYGGGARWFTTPHLAISIDIRFYRIGAQAPTLARPAIPQMTLMVLSAGVGFK